MTTVVNCEQDHPEWHRGHPHAVVWALRIDWDLSSPRTALAGWLLPDYLRQAHVTIAYGGVVGLEFGDDELARDLADLAALAQGPVTITPTGWGAFPTSPHLVVDAPWLHRAQAALTRGRSHRRLDHYRPHVTLGFHAVEVPLTAPVERLRSVPLPAPWIVDQVELLRYDTDQMAGPLTCLGSVDLVSGSWTPTPPGEQTDHAGDE